MITLKNILRARLLSLAILPAALSLALPRGEAQDPAPERTVILQSSSLMKFFKGTVNPPSEWANLDFVDDDWLDGHIPCGYGESIIVAPTWTVFTDMRNNYTTMYVRIPFELDRPERVTELRLEQTSYDDGFIAYVNGMEVVRASMNAGAVNKDTTANSHEYNEGTLTQRLNDPAMLDLLVSGKNILAVELHNTSVTSSDLVFQTTVSAYVIPEAIPEFVRGVDCDGRPELDIGDPIYLLRWQFGGFYNEPGCPKACDTNDDGVVDISDAVAALEYLFLGGAPFPEPYPDVGPDPTDDALSCGAS